MSFPFANKKEATFKDGCLSLRKDILDSMLAKAGPGPIYTPKPRISSQEKSLRSISFGNARRRENIKVNKVPGPQTYDPHAIRNAPQSNKRNVGGYSFGVSERACNTTNVASSKFPSPAEYDPESIRRGITFSKKGMSSVKFGMAKYSNRKPVDLPGPQTYDPGAIKKGIMFTKSSMPSVKFGKPPPKESPLKKRYQKKGSRVPGPQDYDTQSIRNGIFSLSTKKRIVGVKFSTGPRTYNDVEERERASKPGPNSYDIPSALGKQVNSRYKSHPSISFGSR